MALAKKDQIRRLLKSIETGDPGPVAVVNEEKYIQHNPQTQEGSEGLAALFQRLSRTSPRVNIVRAFEDGDFGNRLENFGLVAATVRWTANVLHLFHGRPWDQPGVQEKNLSMVTPRQTGGSYWAQDGLDRFSGAPAGKPA